MAAPGTNNKIYVGSRSGVYGSNDGGDNYFGLANPPEGMTSKFNEITALAIDPANQDHILASPGDYAGYVYSFDSGVSWNLGEHFGSVRKFAFAPSNPSVVYAGTDNGFYASDDGGITFVKKEHVKVNNIQVQALAVHPNNPDVVYASTTSPEIIMTTDGGDIWTNTNNGIPAMPSTIIIINPQNPEVIFTSIDRQDSGIGGTGIYKSIGGGGSWTQVTSGLQPNGLYKCIVIDPTNTQIMYAGDFYSGVYYSTNGGDNWQLLNEGLIHKMVNTLALSDDGSVLYAGIEGGAVFRLGDVTVGVGDEESKIPTGFVLEQNYPNPFNPGTVINYQLSTTGLVKLKVYDVLGNEITTLVDEEKAPGRYQVIFDGSNLVSGVYLYELKTGSYSVTKKMLLLK